MVENLSIEWTAPIGPDATNDQSRASEYIADGRLCGECIFKTNIVTTRTSGRSWKTVACTIKTPREVRSIWERNRTCLDKKE